MVSVYVNWPVHSELRTSLLGLCIVVGFVLGLFQQLHHGAIMHGSALSKPNHTAHNNLALLIMNSLLQLHSFGATIIE